VSLSSNALTTLAKLQQYLDYGDTGDTGTASLWEDFIEDASDRVRSYLGYDPFGDTESDELYDGNGMTRLPIRKRPITALSGIKLDDTSIDVSTFEIRDWYIDGLTYRFIEGNSNYKVSYTHGYGDTLGAIPYAIQLAALKLAALDVLESGKKGYLGISSVTSSGGGSKTYVDKDADKVLEKIEVYRRETW